MTNTPFAQALRAAIEAAGLTVTEAAAVCGLSKRALEYYLAGREPLTTAQADSLPTQERILAKLAGAKKAGAP